MQSRSVLLKNMFNPEECAVLFQTSLDIANQSSDCRETEPDWDTDLADDVKGECTEKYGKVEAIKVERETQVRCLRNWRIRLVDIECCAG